MEKTNCFSLEKSGFYQRHVVGFVTSDVDEKEQLIPCSYAKHISTNYGKPICLCKLAVACFGSCSSNGERIKFKHLYDGFHIVWVCSKLKDLSRLEK